MSTPEKESPALAGPGTDHFDAATMQNTYSEQTLKSRATKPIPVILVMTKATPKGSVVTVPGRLGSERFGEVGQLLLEYVKLHYARTAARMGHQIAFITQSDGKEADWSLSVDAMEAWQASFGQGGD